GDGEQQGPGQDQVLDPAAHLIASLAGASLASGGWSSPPGHRNGAWGALCGVRPGGCGVKLPEVDIGRFMADLRALPWLAPTYPAEAKRAPGSIAGCVGGSYCSRRFGFC